jgi:hypothetical protein
VLCAIAVFALSSRAVAQYATKLKPKDDVEKPIQSLRQVESPRLISSDEGLAIIGAALDIRYHRHARGDCSHLVHDIYQQAGFPYRYADSSELYGGIEAFRLVTHPQPGDLAVWPGHAAIVVNPVQHSFFSSTPSGLRVESYDLKYWKRRGTPRFFRYATLDLPVVSLTRTPDSRTASLRKVGSRPAKSKGPLSVKEDSSRAPN